MHRRDFLKTTSTLLAASAIPGVPALSAEPSDRGRQIFSINRGWRYHPGKVDGAEAITFNDFEGVMTASTVWINGVLLGEYKGGFTPFSFELTPHLRPTGDNVLVVQLDSTERADIPPFGNEIDYLTFGGIYREVALRIVPSVYLVNIFARPKDVLSGKPSLDVD